MHLPIPGYEGFLVDEYGNVKKLPYYYTRKNGMVVNEKEKILTPSKTKKGYIAYDLCYNGFKKRVFAHKLVALAFIGEKPDGMDQINHKDGNKTNNHYSNLEWSNTSLNMKHAWDTGLFNPKLPIGTDYSRAKIVVHSEYGIFFTLQDAAKTIGINRGRLSDMVQNKITNISKYRLCL